MPARKKKNPKTPPRSPRSNPPILSSISPSSLSSLLHWPAPPSSIGVFLRKDTPALSSPYAALAHWLRHEWGINVLVDPAAKSSFLPNEPSWSPEEQTRLGELLDLIITMGGDGTLLYVSSLFEAEMPPIIAFNFGSLGFLTPWPFETFKESLERVFRQASHLNLRRRLHICVVEMEDAMDGEEPQPEQVTQFQVLNEVVIDRGGSPYMAAIDAYVDSHYCTTVAADGVICATPTGSTAYSLSAGGPMVHPSVAGVVFTPICPHSLSFRPVVFPDDACIRLQLPDNARGCARVTLDGRLGPTLEPGDCVLVRISSYPMPCIAPSSDTHTWLASLANVLHWNDRAEQQSLGTLNTSKNDIAKAAAGKFAQVEEEDRGASAAGARRRASSSLTSTPGVTKGRSVSKVPAIAPTTTRATTASTAPTSPRAPALPPAPGTPTAPTTPAPTTVPTSTAPSTAQAEGSTVPKSRSSTHRESTSSTGSSGSVNKSGERAPRASGTVRRVTGDNSKSPGPSRRRARRRTLEARRAHALSSRKESLENLADLLRSDSAAASGRGSCVFGR